MKSEIHLVIPAGSQVKVKVGQVVKEGSVLFEQNLPMIEEAIPVSKALKIKPSLVARYLTKRMGEKVAQGEILAVKKSFFSSFFLHSPVSGLVKEIDLKKGTLLISSASVSSGAVVSPVKGKISQISEKYLQIEIEGEVFPVVRGEGQDKVGKIVFLETVDKADVLDITGDIKGNILAAPDFSSAALVKIEVLGGVGLIVVGKIREKTKLAWVEVSKEVYQNLKKEKGKRVWLRPFDRQIIFLDNEV